MSNNTTIDLEKICMGIIVSSGNARSYLLETLNYMKPKNKEKIKELFKMANAEMKKAHQCQTTLLTKEAQGNDIKMSVLLVHAQDHLMTTIAINDLLEQLVEVL